MMKTMTRLLGALVLTLMAAQPGFPQTAPNMATTDGVQNLTNKRVFAPAAQDASQAAVTAGVTQTGVAERRTFTYQATIPYTSVACAAVTCDFTIGTLPAKSLVHAVTARVSTAWTCAATCTTSTLSLLLGRTAGGNQYLTSSDLDAAIATFEMVTQKSEDYTAAQAMIARFTSGTGNFGDGTTTNLGAGSVTFNVTYTTYP